MKIFLILATTTNSPLLTTLAQLVDILHDDVHRLRTHGSGELPFHSSSNNHLKLPSTESQKAEQQCDRSCVQISGENMINSHEIEQAVAQLSDTEEGMGTNPDISEEYESLKDWNKAKQRRAENEATNMEEGQRIKVEWCCRCKKTSKFSVDGCVAQLCSHTQCSRCLNFSIRSSGADVRA